MDEQILTAPTPSEQWRAITDFEGFYEVSDQGRIKSLARQIMRSNGVKQTFRERILKTSQNSADYPHLTVALHHRDGRQMSFYVHRLVWRAFIDPAIGPDFKLDHRDRNYRNNALSNLRPATRSQNAANAGLSEANTSGFKGVYWEKRRSHWCAMIVVNRVPHYLGRFDTPEEAAAAYAAAAAHHFGEFACLG